MATTSLPSSGDNFLISERFVSLQGEGVSQGAPAAFLRLGNCNLACSYCDTPYSWDSTRYDLQSELQVEDSESVAQWITENSPGRLIITGGEPLLQQKKLVPLLERVDEIQAKSQNPVLFVEVETNGTVTPLPALLTRIDQWNVSPKLSSSGEPRSRCIRKEALTTFAQSSRSYFKFVTTVESDLAEIEDLVNVFSLSRSRVLLMPEARTKEELSRRARRVATWALDKKFRYTGRLHLELYGGKRGT